MTVMQMPEHAALSALPGFDALELEPQRQMALLCAVERLKAEQVVFRYGDAGDALFLIAAGAVEVFTHNNAGQEIVLETVGAVAVLGEVALFSGDTRTANAKASEETILLRIERNAVQAALRLRTSGEKLRHLTTFDKFCAGMVSVLAGVPFLVGLTAGCAWGCSAC